MIARRVRRASAAASIVMVATAGAAFAAGGSDQPQPCVVTYTATPHGGGNPITTTFETSCTADPQWEITSIDLQTSISDTSPIGTKNSCHQQVPGTKASQACSLTGVRLHTYLVTYRLKASGNYAVCLDDGTCDALTPVTDPACTEMLTDPHPSVQQSSLVLDCTYRQAVTVGAP